MAGPSAIYRENLSLLTDFYQVTMAYAAWKDGACDKGPKHKTGVFDLYFRMNPFNGGYAVLCGLSTVLDLIEGFRIGDDDCEYLASLEGGDGKPLFEAGFLDYLRKMVLEIDVDAIDEGRVVFGGEPLLRVTGPIAQCQLLESSLLNVINFETLIATKAARVREAAGSDSVLEFGLRRAQGIDGSLSAARAAYVGGADATSNVLAGKVYGIPVKGTHAHSWVMSYDDEKDSFMSFARAMPNNSIFLVDTYDTIEGVKNAIEAGLWLKSQGHQMAGIRLDSGDLAYLSIEARRLLDEAGLSSARIVASNDLDETLIQNLKQQGAKIDVWGIGTRLVTAYDQPALSGVYKLTAVREGNGPWKSKIKISEQIAKVTNPGIHQVRRFEVDGLFAGDMIFEEPAAPTGEQVIVDPLDPTRRKIFSKLTSAEDLLKPVVRNGRVVANRPSLEAIRSRRESDLARLHPTIRRFLNPHTFPVGLDLGLHEKKAAMVLERRSSRKGNA